MNEVDVRKDNELDEVELSRAPFMDHLIELRSRLIRILAGILIAFVGCFAISDKIYNFLLIPYERAAGDIGEVHLIYTAPQELFFTELKLSLFCAVFIAFPLIAMQVYKFVAPGLYKNEKGAFLPYLIVTPIFFIMGAALVFFIIMPLAMEFFIGMEQTGPDVANIRLEAKVSEYLSLTMTLLFAFGLSFQLPVILTLLAQIGLIDDESLVSKRKYAIVVAFAAAAILTPPDPITQIGLALPIMLLYEISIISVRRMAKRVRADDNADVED